MIDPVLTNVVPAASGRRASDPVALKHADLPVALGVVSQSIWGHVADFNLVIVGFEVLKLHPEIRVKINNTK